MFAGGIAVMYGSSFVWGYLIVCMSATWGIAAWLLSSEVQTHKPKPLQSTTLKKIAQHKLEQRSYRRWQFTVPILVFLFPIGFLVGHLWPKSSSLSPPPSISTSPPLVISDIAIESSVEWGRILPIALKPGEKAQIFAARDDMKVSVTHVLNDGGKTQFWPANVAKFKALGLKLYPEYRMIHISNHSDRQVFSIVSQLRIDFDDPNSRIDFLSKSPPPVGSDTRDIEIESISPGSHYDIYILNESNLALRIWLPSEGTLEVQGQTGRRSIRFSQQMQTILDRESLIVEPTFYVWSGDLPTATKRQN